MSCRSASNRREVRMQIGARIWAIAEGYIPEGSTGQGPEFKSHETACILNTTDHEAHVVLNIFFEDREPAGPYRLTVPARRTVHMRFNDLTEPERLPRGKGYASLFQSDVPVVIQHTRLDSRQEALALISTVAYAAQ